MKKLDWLRGEFIGKQVKVAKQQGKIIDETKHSFLVQVRGEQKRFLKTGKIFEIKINNQFVPIEGNVIELRPEDRIKIKKW